MNDKPRIAFAFEVEAKDVGDVMIALDRVRVINLRSTVLQPAAAPTRTAAPTRIVAPEPKVIGEGKAHGRTTRTDEQGFSQLDRAIIEAIGQAKKPIRTNSIQEHCQTAGFKATGLHKRLSKLSASGVIKRHEAGLYGVSKSFAAPAAHKVTNGEETASA